MIQSPAHRRLTQTLADEALTLLQNNRPRIDANGNGIAGDAGDDFNGDGELGDVLDGEIAGVLALHASIGNPPQVNVGVVAFQLDCPLEAWPDADRRLAQLESPRRAEDLAQILEELAA